MWQNERDYGKATKYVIKRMDGSEYWICLFGRGSSGHEHEQRDQEERDRREIDGSDSAQFSGI